MKYIIDLKKIALGLFVASLLIFPAAISAAPKAKAETDQQRIDNLKERANREIDRRVASFTRLATKITSIKKLSEAQKSSFAAEIQKSISELNALKTKVGNDTEITTLRADVKSIIDSYKVFGVFMPKIHLLAAVNKTDQAQIKLAAIAVKLEAQISTLKAEGKDVTSLEADLADMKAKLSDAQTQIEALQSKIIAVTVQGYPGNKGILVEGKNSLATIKKDLATTRADAKKIVNSIKALNSSAVSADSEKETSGE